MSESTRLVGPAYDLAKLQLLWREKHTRMLTRAAELGAAILGFTRDDVAAVINELSDCEFRQTLISHRFRGHRQDVYWPEHRGVWLYVKVQIRDGVAVVISFKKNTDIG